MKDFEPIFTHSLLESVLWCFSPNSTVAIKRCSSWNDETASTVHYSPVASCCLLCACSNKNPFLQCGICLGLKWSTPTRIQVQRENKLNAQNGLLFFNHTFPQFIKGNSLFFPPWNSSLGKTKQWFCGLFGASYISCISEAPGSLSATEKRRNYFGFGIVWFTFYLKLARLQ